jgi:hypothetical protein
VISFGITFVILSAGAWKLFTEDSFGAMDNTAMFMSSVLTRLPIETVDKSIGLKSSFNSPPTPVADESMYFAELIVSCTDVLSSVVSDIGFIAKVTPLASSDSSDVIGVSK